MGSAEHLIAAGSGRDGENRPPPSALDLLAVGEARLVVGVAAFLWLLAASERSPAAYTAGLAFLAYGGLACAALRCSRLRISDRGSGGDVFNKDAQDGQDGDGRGVPSCLSWASLLKRRPGTPQSLLLALALLDLLFAGALVLAAGRSAAPFYLTYLFPIAAVGLHRGVLAGYGAALGAGGLDAAAHYWSGGAAALEARAVPITSLLILTLLMGQLLEVWRRRRARAVRGEQARIARDLHDDFVQALVAVGLRVEYCRTVAAGPPTILEEELFRLHELINTCLRDIRRYLSRMRAAPVEELGLATCVRRVAEDVFRHSEVRSAVAIKLPPWPLPPEVETAAFYLVREALFNVRKHARAAHVFVQVEYRQHRLWLQVTDDGVGFSAEDAALLSDRHHGLRSMRERVEALSGTLCFQSVGGRGTRIEAAIPVKGN